METLPAPEVILFDLDDTLIDRHASLRQYTGALARVFGDRLANCPSADLEALVLAVDGRHGPGDEAAAELARRLPWQYSPATACEVETCWQAHFPESVQATDGLEAVLARLRKRRLRIAIVTNGANAWQRRKIERLGLAPLVDGVVVSETIGVRKPDGRIFAHALAGLGIAPHLAWMVGDDPIKDIAGAAAAGMVAVWFRRRGAWPASLPEPDAEIKHLREILPLVDAALTDSTRRGP